MSVFVVDIEADGPTPGIYSMTELGVVKINEDHTFETFYRNLRPITEKYKTDALRAIGKTREETLEYDDPRVAMFQLERWVKNHNTNNRPMFYSDNAGFDWQFINYYCWLYMDRNPFGHSSADIGSLYKGLEKSVWRNFKHLRKTKHTHHPVDDAKGNAEALIEMYKKGLKISFK